VASAPVSAFVLAELQAALMTPRPSPNTAFDGAASTARALAIAWGDIRSKRRGQVMASPAQLGRRQ
jgi:hypothetical protein